MNCPICLENPEQPTVLNCCKNTYCLKCIKEWQSVRNVCPLCCTVSGDQEYNSLKKVQTHQFDDGFLMLETEKNQINQRIIYLEERVHSRKEQFKNNYKSGVSASLMQYLQQQILRLQLFRNCMEANTVEYMQLLTETILNIQNSLDTGSIMVDDYEQYDEFDDDEYLEEMMYQYQQYDDYQVNAKKKSGQRFSKQKIGIGQQKNKISKA